MEMNTAYRIADGMHDRKASVGGMIEIVSKLYG